MGNATWGGALGMNDRCGDDRGLSLVEVVIAMMVLAVIAVALLPSLWQGLLASGRQSATATATRHLYSLIEDARATPTCLKLTEVTAADSITDGKGADIDISSVYAPSDCAKGVAVPLTLIATDASGVELAQVDARVYIP
ncbi:prepilin-type N-terminal cleavage/methylation domain-containing protein [Microbacterium sp. NPDC056736]|uniref:type IV pilus modification PilV family protein n=1 Tax=Microbacterium sp. NPDC056736 TaxID=3345932 RepID=UPI00366C1011